MTVKEMSEKTGVSIRTLRYYDEIGLLIPDEVTEAGYRIYHERSMLRLQQILLLRELGFPLREIGSILDHPEYDQAEALEKQIALLTLKRDHLNGLIAFARHYFQKGEAEMNFEPLAKEKLEEYRREAKKQWGHTEAYGEYEARAQGQTVQEEADKAAVLMEVFRELGTMKTLSPESPVVQNQVKKLQDTITARFYTCTKPILAGLGSMYAAGGEMTENIDKVGGAGTAFFAAKAITIYTKK